MHGKKLESVSKACQRRVDGLLVAAPQHTITQLKLAAA